MGRSLAGAWSSPWESALVGALAAPAFGMVMKFNNPTSDKAPIAKKALVKYSVSFRRLNSSSWIESYFTIAAHHRQMLERRQSTNRACCPDWLLL